VLDGGRIAQHRRQRRDQVGVDHQELVAGVVDDVRELVGPQADVDRVIAGARQRRGEVDLQVAVVVPAERAHPVATGDAEVAQGGGEPGDPVGPVGVAGARHLAGGAAADELLVGEQRPGALVQVP
jgi:hypothetical protein